VVKEVGVAAAETLAVEPISYCKSFALDIPGTR